MCFFRAWAVGLEEVIQDALIDVGDVGYIQAMRMAHGYRVLEQRSESVKITYVCRKMP
jgi:hypothetical protein